MTSQGLDRNAELEPTLQGVLEIHDLPADLGRAVATKAFVKRFGSSLSRHRKAAVPTTDALPWLLVALLVGVLFGYLILPTQGALGDVLMWTQMLGGRGRLGGQGMGSMSSIFLPAASGTLRVIFLIFALLFVTRARVWKTIFPQRLPAGLATAQWLALIAAIFGILRIVGSCYLAVMVFGAADLMGRRATRDSESIVGITILADQIWWLTFWVASLTVMFVILGVWTQHYWRAAATDE